VIGALRLHEADRAFVLDRAVRSRRIDRTQAEAMLLLPTALTIRGARMLADQAEGALARAVRRARRPDALLVTAPLGCALVSPPRVVIAGRPNVGKSTLLNALVGRDRALVSPVAGTTRDPVADTIAIDGIPFVLVDTAGLSGAAGPLDRLSMERARQEIARADLVLQMGDEIEFAGRVLKVRRGNDLGRLRRAIPRALGLTGRLRPGAPAIFTARQRAILEEGGRDWKRWMSY
jgi:tRNA U34 5-carboxymethylaminomethyl modifying GTPase MnmE/TrmE